MQRAEHLRATVMGGTFVLSHGVRLAQTHQPQAKNEEGDQREHQGRRHRMGLERRELSEMGGGAGFQRGRRVYGS